MSGQKGKVHLGPNVSSSAHYRRCVVNGSGAMAATWGLLLLHRRGFLCLSTTETISGTILIRAPLNLNRYSLIRTACAVPNIGIVCVLTPEMRTPLYYGHSLLSQTLGLCVF